MSISYSTVAEYRDDSANFTFHFSDVTASPVAAVSGSTGTVQKGTAETGQFTFTRTGATLGALPVSFSVSTGTGQAVYGSDYTLTAIGSVTIPAGESSAVVTLTPLESVEPTGSLSVTLTVHAGDGYTVNPATATIQIADSPINQWKMAEFGSLALAQSPEAADLADPEGDGVCNLLKYALGQHPLSPFAGVPPQIGFQPIGGKTYLSYTFIRPSPAPPDVTYIVETSHTLNSATWTPALLLTGYPLNLENGTEQVIYYSSEPMESTAAEFIRLRVTRQ